MLDVSNTSVRYFAIQNCNGVPALHEETLDYMDLTCLLSGEMVYYYNGEQLHLKTGDAILFPKYTTRMRLGGDTPVNYVSFNIFVPDAFTPIVAGVMKNCLTSRFYTILDMFILEWTAETSFSKQQQLLLFFYLYNHLADVVLNSQNTYVATIKQYIYKHLSSPLRIEDIAAEVHLVPAYCCALFKKETGETIVNYINRQRIEMAKQQFSLGETSVKKVAQQVGFRNTNYFTETFRRYVGMAPREFLKKNYEVSSYYVDDVIQETIGKEKPL